MLIIGITGTNGSGKGTVVEYLIQKGFKHYSARDLIKREVVSRGLAPNRENMILVANDLRAKFSPGYVAEALYEEALRRGDNAVIESLRTPGEVKMLREKENFYLWAVDADPKIRYERVKLRQSETDNISFEQFLAEEEREMTSTDETKQNISKCIELADFKLMNNGTKEDLFKETEKVLNLMNEK